MSIRCPDKTNDPNLPSKTIYNFFYFYHLLKFMHIRDEWLDTFYFDTEVSYCKYSTHRHKHTHTYTESSYSYSLSLFFISMRNFIWHIECTRHKNSMHISLFRKDVDLTIQTYLWYDTITCRKLTKKHRSIFISTNQCSDWFNHGVYTLNIQLCEKMFIEQWIFGLQFCFMTFWISNKSTSLDTRWINLHGIGFWLAIELNHYTITRIEYFKCMQHSHIGTILCCKCCVIDNKLIENLLKIHTSLACA